MTPFTTTRKIRQVHLHHSAGSELDSPDKVASYAVERDIGISHDPYHMHIWRPADSGVPEGANQWVQTWGRDFEEVPASDQGHNTGAFAICVHGNYHETPLPTFALDRLVEAVRWVLDGTGLGASDVYGHRELPGAATLCPGYDPAVVRAAL